MKFFAIGIMTGAMALAGCSGDDEHGALGCDVAESAIINGGGSPSGSLAVDASGNVYAGTRVAFGVRDSGGGWSFDPVPYGLEYGAEADLVALPTGEIAAVLDGDDARLHLRKEGAWSQEHVWENASCSGGPGAAGVAASPAGDLYIALDPLGIQKVTPGSEPVNVSSETYLDAGFTVDAKGRLMFAKKVSKAGLEVSVEGSSTLAIPAKDIIQSSLVAASSGRVFALLSERRREAETNETLGESLIVAAMDPETGAWGKPQTAYEWTDVPCPDGLAVGSSCDSDVTRTFHLHAASFQDDALGFVLVLRERGKLTRREWDWQRDTTKEWRILVARLSDEGTRFIPVELPPELASDDIFDATPGPDGAVHMLLKPETVGTATTADQRYIRLTCD
jgi:hypothetical protein